MIILVATGLLFVVLAFGGYKLATSGNDGLEIVGTFSSIMSFIVLCVFLAVGYGWVAAGHKADTINAQLGTEYTQSDVFYASEYIDEVRQLHRHRIELNGDLLKEKTE